jgi:hypothetical protein
VSSWSQLGLVAVLLNLLIIGIRLAEGGKLGEDALHYANEPTGPDPTPENPAGVSSCFPSWRFPESFR